MNKNVDRQLYVGGHYLKYECVVVCRIGFGQPAAQCAAK